MKWLRHPWKTYTGKGPNIDRMKALFVIVLWVILFFFAAAKALKDYVNEKMKWGEFSDSARRLRKAKLEELY